MRLSVLELKDFYASPMGAVARRMIGRKVTEQWGGESGLDVLALGYATPFLAEVGERARRVVAAMPGGQGAEPWPASGRNLACLVEEPALPFANALFDRVLAAHALEESDQPVALLRQVGRVMSPSGRLIIAVTARHSLWADAETTPFGQGRPFSRRQLERLLREAELEPVGWTRALYAPPVAWASRWAETFEQLGARLWPPLAGVILMEAMKQSYAMIGAAARPRPRPIPARALRPAAVARDRTETGHAGVVVPLRPRTP